MKKVKKWQQLFERDDGDSRHVEKYSSMATAAMLKSTVLFQP